LNFRVIYKKEDLTSYTMSGKSAPFDFWWYLWQMLVDFFYWRDQSYLSINVYKISHRTSRM